MHIPRIGQEVIVDFLEGDPDRPIITGRVYNGANMPPYGLGASASKSTIRSHSTKGGGPNNYNELCFEDKIGDEQVYLQAEKDLEILVKNDEHREVKHDRKKDVGNDETTTVGGNRNETVTKDETISISGNRTETVTKNETITIDGARSETVAKDETITINGGRTETSAKNETITIGGQTVSITKDRASTSAVAPARKPWPGRDRHRLDRWQELGQRQQGPDGRRRQEVPAHRRRRDHLQDRRRQHHAQERRRHHHQGQERGGQRRLRRPQRTAVETSR